MTNEEMLARFFQVSAPQSALEPSRPVPQLHVAIEPVFPPAAVRLGPKFEDLAKRSAPGSATNLDLTYTWRK